MCTSFNYTTNSVFMSLGKRGQKTSSCNNLLYVHVLHITAIYTCTCTCTCNHMVSKELGKKTLQFTCTCNGQSEDSTYIHVIDDHIHVTAQTIPPFCHLHVEGSLRHFGKYFCKKCIHVPVLKTKRGNIVTIRADFQQGMESVSYMYMYM